ncbi:MAG: hypothetical protein GFH27_549411n3 [Chloroflexi bacterium AL-W]|nr:hypothetical protein [Chloroflexi bacterium AL-W]
MLRRFFGLCLLICFASVPIYAQDDAPSYPCMGDLSEYLAPRLQVGQAARVLTVPLNFRPQPSTTLARIDQLPPATTVQVIGGPACNQGFIWWQIQVGEQIGWVAEGTTTPEAIYWVEPRGELITLMGDDGRPRYYIETEADQLEPEGCMRPPDDYSRTEIGFATLNRRTLFMLDNASRIYREWGGAYSFRDLITQGSYNPGGVDASFGTHDGGGAVDISVRSRVDWSIMWAEIPYMIEALRISGFAAWVREQDELFPNSAIHIHAIAVGDADLSPIARAQVDGERGYLRGYNGLPESYGLPILDGWGDVIICSWMIADNIIDLREAAYFEAIGGRYAEAGDYQGALMQFTRGIETFPGSAALYLARAGAHQALGMMEEAEADLAVHGELTKE